MDDIFNVTKWYLWVVVIVTVFVTIALSFITYFISQTKQEAVDQNKPESYQSWIETLEVICGICTFFVGAVALVAIAILATASFSATHPKHIYDYTKDYMNAKVSDPNPNYADYVNRQNYNQPPQNYNLPPQNNNLPQQNYNNNLPQQNNNQPKIYNGL